MEPTQLFIHLHQEAKLAISILNTLDQVDRFVDQARSSGQTIGVVPTMGALHPGHLSLAEHSLRETDQTIVTIFVNPTQFAAGEDLDQYPRTLDADVAKLEALAGGEQITVFAPATETMYPADCTSAVVPPAICKKLEGEFRPSHFAGVATIVLKILNITRADKAFFGQKDFQQVAVVKRMVKDLNVPTEICACPIVRAPDGLALSSRNVYLSSEEREVALTIHRTLNEIESQVKEGQRDGFEVITEMRQRLIDGGVDSIDYAVIAHPETLETSDPIQLPAVALIAVHVGNTRLLDNCLIDSEK